MSFLPCSEPLFTLTLDVPYLPTVLSCVAQRRSLTSFFRRAKQRISTKTLARDVECLMGMFEECTGRRYGPLVEIEPERIFSYRGLRLHETTKRRCRSMNKTITCAMQTITVPKSPTWRRSSRLFVEQRFHSFALNQMEWLRHRKANEKDVSVSALAFIIAAHERRHMGVLSSRCLQS
jgi:hypothetical protein